MKLTGHTLNSRSAHGRTSFPGSRANPGSDLSQCLRSLVFGRFNPLCGQARRIAPGSFPRTSARQTNRTSHESGPWNNNRYGDEIGVMKQKGGSLGGGRPVWPESLDEEGRVRYLAQFHCAAVERNGFCRT